MKHHAYLRIFPIVVLGAVFGTAMLSIEAQQTPHLGHGSRTAPHSMGEHEEHGTPEGWTFTWPKGDPTKGREVFVKLECYSCHEVKGETFPAPGGDVGPELSAMGPLHEAEYFAEAVIYPDAVIEPGRGYEDEAGRSKMPSYNDIVTAQEVIDLVAYLTSLRPPVDAPPGHESAPHAPVGHDRH